MRGPAAARTIGFSGNNKARETDDHAVGDAKASNDDHAAIVAALAAGDMGGAAELMREHIDTLAACLDERRASGPNRLRALLARGARPAARKRSQAAS
jgi:DNA-binding GntR family transcriptional regulator